MDVRLWAVPGVRIPPGGSAGARQRLGEGVRFEKGVPRAASRARLINKLIKFREFRIHQNIQKDQKAGDQTRRWLEGLANCNHTETVLIILAGYLLPKPPLLYSC